MEQKRIRKINWAYLFGYIFGPAILSGICFLISARFFPKGYSAVVLILGPCLLSFLWWVFAGRILFKRKTKQFERELKDGNFNLSYTFYANGKTVCIDEEHGNVGLVFFWNPFETFVFPASRIEKAWVDDGKHGAGFMAGSSRVSFLFLVDGVKVRVDTFTSNRRWRMDSDYILTGVSKADVVVQSLKEAKGRSGRQ